MLLSNWPARPTKGSPWVSSSAPGPSRALAPTRGQLYDHIGLSVADLDAWIAKLQSEHVKLLGRPYKLGGLRAVMIEGPSREVIELVEVKAENSR